MDGLEKALLIILFENWKNLLLVDLDFGSKIMAIAVIYEYLLFSLVLSNFLISLSFSIVMLSVLQCLNDMKSSSPISLLPLLWWWCRKKGVSYFELKKQTNKPKTSKVGKREVVNSIQKVSKRYHSEVLMVSLFFCCWFHYFLALAWSFPCGCLSGKISSYSLPKIGELVVDELGSIF